jgi:hypothetical protein
VAGRHGAAIAATAVEAGGSDHSGLRRAHGREEVAVCGHGDTDRWAPPVKFQ